MKPFDAALRKMRAICLSLPDTKETPTWGKPHFRVADKIFCGYGDEGRGPAIGFKLDMTHARLLVRDDPRFTPAPYVGHKGWVSMDAARVTDWDELRRLVTESFRLIAPKKSLAKLYGEMAPPKAPAKPKKAAARKPAAKPKAAKRKPAAKSKAARKPAAKPARRKSRA